MTTERRRTVHNAIWLAAEKLTQKGITEVEEDLVIHDLAESLIAEPVVADVWEHHRRRQD